MGEPRHHDGQRSIRVVEVELPKQGAAVVRLACGGVAVVADDVRIRARVPHRRVDAVHDAGHLAPGSPGGDDSFEAEPELRGRQLFGIRAADRGHARGVHHTGLQRADEPVVLEGVRMVRSHVGSRSRSRSSGPKMPWNGDVVDRHHRRDVGSGVVQIRGDGPPPASRGRARDRVAIGRSVRRSRSVPPPSSARRSARGCPVIVAVDAVRPARAIEQVRRGAQQQQIEPVDEHDLTAAGPPNRSSVRHTRLERPARARTLG